MQPEAQTMKKLFIIITVLIVFAGCKAPVKKDPQAAEKRDACRKAAAVISKLRRGAGDVNLENQYKDELVKIGLLATQETINIALNEKEYDPVRIAMLDVVYRMGDKRVYPYLIRILRSQSEKVRAKSCYLLRNFTGLNMHYRPGAGPGPERAETIRRWLKWWLKNKEKLDKENLDKGNGSLSYPEEWDKLTE
jgi:hypothetical protein